MRKSKLYVLAKYNPALSDDFECVEPEIRQPISGDLAVARTPAAYPGAFPRHHYNAPGRHPATDTTETFTLNKPGEPCRVAWCQATGSGATPSERGVRADRRARGTGTTGAQPHGRFSAQEHRTKLTGMMSSRRGQIGTRTIISVFETLKICKCHRNVSPFMCAL